MPPLVPPPSDVPPPGMVVVLRVVVVVGVVVGAKHGKIESFKAKMYMKLCKMCIKCKKYVGKTIYSLYLCRLYSSNRPVFLEHSTSFLPSQMHILAVLGSRIEREAHKLSHNHIQLPSLKPNIRCIKCI